MFSNISSAVITSYPNENLNGFFEDGSYYNPQASSLSVQVLCYVFAGFYVLIENCLGNNTSHIDDI